MAKFIEGPEAMIIRTGDTTVELRIYGGDTFEGLEPRRLFPMSGLTRYITLLDADSRKAVEDCLNEYYLIPKITEVISITEKFGVLTWNCMTDHGARSFRIRNRHSDIKRLYDGRVLVRDSNDNRYEIENVFALSKRSQALLSSEL